MLVVQKQAYLTTYTNRSSSRRHLQIEKPRAIVFISDLTPNGSTYKDSDCPVEEKDSKIRPGR